MISIIIPVYNVQPYIRQAIDSVINQSYRELEILLVDDGSTDGSAVICDEYAVKDSRVRVIHQKNAGLSCARNVGLDAATGEYIAFLDPDDAFHKDMLALCMEAIRESRSDITECRVLLTYESGTLDLDRLSGSEGLRGRAYTGTEALHLKVRGRIRNNVWNKLYVRSIWDGLRFPPGQNYEDRDIILKIISRCERYYVLEAPLVMHRKRGDSISGTHNLKNISDYILGSRNYMQFITDHTPELFTYEDLCYAGTTMMDSFIKLYYGHLADKGSESESCTRILEEQINSYESRLDMKNCSFRTKAGLFVFHHMPAATGRVIYLCYSFFKKIYKKVFRL